ncbi:MAG TPA: hypothetical protein VD838_09445 [Anaeromyxobacteraceae bacterium]|nr:hypothetical protein [Anaeromyxobacteraceae bacterium]
MTAPDTNARRNWPCLYGVPALPAGAVLVDLGGNVLRVLEDGGVEELQPGAMPRRGVTVGGRRGLST